ncbi:MAG: alpha/beta hydrolase [Pseudomonadota bacterium]|nr:alpha/beta hydrolase [Pseudomonadota bacterium]
MNTLTTINEPVPLFASRRLSLQARVLLWIYRFIVKASLSKRVELDRAQALLVKLDRWLGGGRANFTSESHIANGVPTDRITVGDTPSKRVLLYLHGGGFMFRTPRLHARLAARLCQALDATAVMPDYRLAPEHPLPAAHEDCFAVYRWLLDQGHDPRHIIVIGDSAGGLLTLATLQRIRDAGLPSPACGVMFSPGSCFDSMRPLDARSTDSDPMIGAGVLDLMQRVVVAAVGPNDPSISPCAGSLRGLPPLLFQVGSTELLRHQSEKAAALASSAGTHVELQIWPRMPHVWQAVHWLPEANQALECVGEFVDRHSIVNV